MTCPRCNKPANEERIRVKRDGSTIIRAIHDDGTKDHMFHEWSSVSDFMDRKDVKSRDR